MSRPCCMSVVAGYSEAKLVPGGKLRGTPLCLEPHALGWLPLITKHRVLTVATVGYFLDEVCASLYGQGREKPDPCSFSRLSSPA